MTTLRRVLALFEEQGMPLTVGHVSRSLGLERGSVEGMLTFWVQKGKLRLRTGGCSSCGGKADCPFMPKLAEMYELTSIPIGVCQNKNTG